VEYANGRLNSKARICQKKRGSRKNRRNGLLRKFVNFNGDARSWKGMMID
jgi:hypothetical protein